MGSAEITGRKEGGGPFPSLRRISVFSRCNLMRGDHRRLVNFRNWLDLVTKHLAEH
jgi:hypothetical protein